MRELRLVGPGDDSEHVRLETLDGAEQFSLRVDDPLRSLIGPAPSRTAPSTRVAPEPNAIRPREIQVRVRAGEAPAALADEAGVSIDRVLLFAAPVLDERSRMAGEARRARARRSTPEGQQVAFGDAVDERFLAHGIDPAAVTWDSYRREDGQWVVSARWRGGESDRVAEWAFMLATRTVTPLDETAADLLSDRPIRPVVSAVAGLRPSPPPVPVMTPAAADADAPTGPLPRTLARPAASDEEPFDHERSPGEDQQTPPLPLQLVETRARNVPPPARGEEASREEETEEQKAARARIPSWDDILLGVRRKRD